MSWVAEAKASSHSTASDIWKKCDTGSVSATSASEAPIASCIARIQMRLVANMSTSGDQIGFTSHGRWSQLGYSAMSALELPSVLYTPTDTGLDHTEGAAEGPGRVGTQRQ